MSANFKDYLIAVEHALKAGNQIAGDIILGL